MCCARGPSFPIIYIKSNLLKLLSSNFCHTISRHSERFNSKYFFFLLSVDLHLSSIELALSYYSKIDPTLKMRRNCNLELRLLPYSASLPSAHSDDRQQPPMMEERSGNPQQKNREQKQQQQQQQQPLTIFYNGKICVSDVTEFQARAILLLATREMEERLKATPTSGSEPSSPTSLLSPLYTPTAGLSMKRSLQRFLQKRKHRSQAASPYNH